MRRFYVYDQGSSPREEDGLVKGSRIFGVLDGVSAPFGPAFPQELYDGLSGGEVVARMIERELISAEAVGGGNLLFEDVMYVNDRVGQFNGPDVTSDQRHGATFAFGKLRGETLEIVQAGDCFAIVEKKSGEVIVSPNTVRAHDTEMNAVIEQIQRDVAKELFGLKLEDVPKADQGKVRGEMWNRFCLTLGQARIADMNQKESSRGYGLLSGQVELKRMIWSQLFFVSDIVRALFVTNGLIPWSVMKSRDDQEVGDGILAAFKVGGISGLLTAARGEEKEHESTHYTNQSEATGYVIEF